MKNEPFYRKIIRWLYIKILDEMYIPYGAIATMTYRAGNRRGIRIGYPKKGRWAGVQERYFDMPEDVLKDK